MPALSEEEVRRFVQLGEYGWERYREGDEKGAERAFLAQVSIFPPNYEPFVSLALLEASRGSREKAEHYLRAALVRGFTDVRRIEKAEAWTRYRKSQWFHRLKETVPMLAAIERKWCRWGSMGIGRVPEDLDLVMAGQVRAARRIDAMAPALGPRLERLWKRMITRTTAAMLEAYVERYPDSTDLEAALGHLMTLYAAGPLQQWQAYGAGTSRRVGSVAEAVVERFPESDLRSTALLARALALNGRRDKRGRLKEDEIGKIRSLLDEAMAAKPGVPVLATAAVGRMMVEVETGNAARAEELYRKFFTDHAEESLLLARVRNGLGEQALLLGGLPAFRADALDGGTVGPDALAGKVAVLDFWATWCEPCVDGFPSMQRIAGTYGDQVELIGVNLDWGEDISRDELQSWIAGKGFPGLHIHDGLAWDSEMVRLFGVREIPFNVVIGRNGEVLAVNRHGKQLEKVVRQAVRAR